MQHTSWLSTQLLAHAYSLLSQNNTAVKAAAYCIKHWYLTLSSDSNCRRAICNRQNQLTVIKQRSLNNPVYQITMHQYRHVSQCVCGQKNMTNSFVMICIVGKGRCHIGAACDMAGIRHAWKRVQVKTKLVPYSHVKHRAQSSSWSLYSQLTGDTNHNK